MDRVGSAQDFEPTYLTPLANPDTQVRLDQGPGFFEFSPKAFLRHPIY